MGRVPNEAIEAILLYVREGVRRGMDVEVVSGRAVRIVSESFVQAA